MTPSEQNSRVPINAVISGVFSEAINPVTLNERSFRLGPGGPSVLGRLEVAADGLRFWFTPDRALRIGASHFVGILPEVTDLAGNPIRFTSASFTTGFGPLEAATKVVTVSPADGARDVPTNAQVSVLFDHAVSAAAIDERTIRVTRDGVVLEGAYALTDGDRRVVFRPREAWEVGVEYRVSVSGVLDITGAPIERRISSTFQTGASPDVDEPMVGSMPRERTSTNSIILLSSHEALDSTTVTQERAHLTKNNRGLLGFELDLDATRRVVTATPSEPLFPHTQYDFEIDLEDLAGNRATVRVDFETGPDTDNTPPSIVALSPPDGTQDVPMNLEAVTIHFSEPVSVTAPGAIRLSTAREEEVRGSLVLLVGDIAVFTPAADLEPGEYTLRIDVLDAALHPLRVESRFRVVDRLDRRPPQVTIQPVHGSDSVPLDRVITVTFDEIIDPTTLYDSVRFAEGPLPPLDVSSPSLAAELAISNDGGVTTLRITPRALRPATLYHVVLSSFLTVRDLAGNYITRTGASFRTVGGPPDTIPPRVVSVEPLDGSTGFDPGRHIVVRFSEDMDLRSVVAGAALFVGTRPELIELDFEPDLTTVVISPRDADLDGGMATLILSDGIRDLAGNALTPFASRFTAAPAAATLSAAPRLESILPPPFTVIDPDAQLVLFFDRPLAARSLAAGIVIARNGTLFPATPLLHGDGGIVELRSQEAFGYGAMLEVFVTGDLLSASGAPYENFSLLAARFTTPPNPDESAPTALDVQPREDVPTNAAFLVRLSRAADATGLSADAVRIVAMGEGGPVPQAAALELDDEGTLLRVVPSADLPPAASIRLEVSEALRTPDGIPFRASSWEVSVGLAADTRPPVRIAVSPADGFAGAPINTRVSIHLDEPVNALSVNANTVRVLDPDGIALPHGALAVAGDSVRLRLRNGLTVAGLHRVVVDGVTDRAGNAVAPFALQFLTGAEWDRRSPEQIAVTPVDRAQGVPAETRLAIELDETIDTTTLGAESFFLTLGGFESIPGLRVLEAEGRVLRFSPDAPLTPGDQYTLVLRGIEDLAGNGIDAESTFIVDSGPRSPLTVLGTFPADGATIPTHPLLAVDFSNTIDSLTVNPENVMLTANGTPVPSSLSLAGGGRCLQILPLELLAPATEYTLHVAHLRDASGSEMQAPRDFHFTTTVPVLSHTVLTRITPADAATDVPLNTLVVLEFNNPLFPASVSVETVLLVHNYPVDAEVTISDDGRHVTIRPRRPLAPASQYFPRLAGIIDAFGRPVETSIFTFGSFTTGRLVDTTPPLVAAVSPPDGLAGVAANAIVEVLFSEPMELSADRFRLDGPGGGVEGAITFNGSTLTFQPARPLIPGEYTVLLTEFADLAGHMLSFRSAFSTVDSVDATPPRVTITPLSGSTDFPLDGTVVVSFSEVVAPTTVRDSVSVSRRIPSGAAAPFHMDVAIVDGGTRVALAPESAWLPSTEYMVSVRQSTKDLAGLALPSAASSGFRTVDGEAETIPPEVIAVQPPDGARDVRRGTPICVLFSEPVLAASLRRGAVVYFDGQEIEINMRLSTDGRSAELEPLHILSLEPDLVTVALTSSVTDLAGNPLQQFISRFHVAAFGPTAPELLTSTHPRAGATNVATDASIVLVFGEPVDRDSLIAGLRVTEGGRTVAGELRFENDDRVAEFLPARAYRHDIVVSVRLAEGIHSVYDKAIDANASFAFVTGPEPDAVEPMLVGFGPTEAAPGNAVFLARFSAPIDPATITPAEISVVRVAGNAPLSGSRSLEGEGRVFRFAPAEELPIGTELVFSFSTRVRGNNGNPLKEAMEIALQISRPPNASTPQLIAMTPSDGAREIGTNAFLGLRFDGPVHPLTIERGIRFEDASRLLIPCTVLVEREGSLVSVFPHRQLRALREHTVTVEGVTGLSGNPVNARTIHFTTAAGPDGSRPSVLAVSWPSSEAVPRNARIAVRCSEPLDPLYIDQGAVSVTAGEVAVQGEPRLSADGRTIEFVPVAFPPVGGYRVVLSGVRDLVGNPLTDAFLPFAIADALDNEPPVFEGHAIGDVADAPLDPILELAFNEALSGLSNLRLFAGDVEVPGRVSLSGASRRIRFHPFTLLQPETEYFLSFDEVEDPAGNRAAGTERIPFRTGSRIDGGG